MKHNNAYYIKYRLYQWGEVKGVDLLASNKAEAYDKAVFEAIPAKESTTPYSAWVYSVTYNNGNYRTFNTCEGNPY